MPALAFALLIAAGAMPAPNLAEAGERTTVRAELGELSLADNVMRGEGGVVLESGGLALRADLLEYDLEAREGSAAGNLVFVDGDIVLLADEGLFALGGQQRLTIREATLLQKRKAASPAAYASMSAAQTRGAGKNELILQAEQIERIARTRFLARRLRMTFCDCGEGCTPDWSISASSADVEVGERAILRWPTFRVRGVPVLLLPALYLPLSDRRTGLLFPQLGWKDGPVYDQPFFLTLGESYDLTLTLGGRVGLKPDDPQERSPTRGVRGSAEFRYFPVESTSGRLFAAGMNDRGSEAGRDPRGWRGELALRHRTELDGGLGLQADAKLVSDALYLTDEATDVLRAGAIPYLRSQAHGFWRTENALLTLSSGWYQELADVLFDSPERRLFGPDAPISFQRPISARLQVPRLSLFGPLRAGLEIEAAHYRPVAPGGELTVERLQRSWLTQDTGALPLSLSRLDARPSVTLSLLDRGPVHLEAYAAARADVSAYAPVVGDGPRRTEVWGRAIAGLWAGTEVSRVYGQGKGALRHTIAPRLELRASTPEYGERAALDGFVLPVDEYDRYQRAADPRLLQGIASVSTRLGRRKGGDLLNLELGQGFDLASGALGDSYGRLDLGSRYVTVGAGGRWDHAQRELSALKASLGLRDGRGDALSVSYDRLLASGTDRMRAGLDDLFGPSPAVDSSVGSKDQVNLSATFKPLRTVSLGYGLTMLPRAENKVLSHSGALGLSSDCDCWKLRLNGRWEPKPSVLEDGVWKEVDDVFVFGITLELKNLGSFGL